MRETIIQLTKKGLLIPATDGKNMLANADSAYYCFIEEEFLKYRTNVESPPTEPQLVDVYKQTGKSTYYRIFADIDKNLDNLTLTQPQILLFARQHRQWLCTNEFGHTYFLFKINEDFFVAGINMTDHQDLQLGLRLPDSSRIDPYGSRIVVRKS
jgi:hypothetical protein